MDFANKPLRPTFGLRESGIAPTNKPPKARQRSGPFHWHVVIESTIDATTFYLEEILGCAAAARSSELDEGLRSPDGMPSCCVRVVFVFVRRSFMLEGPSVYHHKYEEGEKEGTKGK